MSLDVSISLAVPGDLDELLPLVSGYQEFYAIKDVDVHQTRAFFGDVIRLRQNGYIMCARLGIDMVGFATGYITVSGYFAAQVVHMGDLFVSPSTRKRGIGRALISAISAHASSLGILRVRWLTSPTNHGAHRLYDGVGAIPTDCRLYVLSSS